MLIDHGDWGEYTASNGMVWRLEKVTDSGLGTYWRAFLPSEYSWMVPPGFTAMRQMPKGVMFERHVDGDFALNPTIESCIEAYTAELERRRRDGNPDENLVRIERPA